MIFQEHTVSLLYFTYAMHSSEGVFLSARRTPKAEFSALDV